MGIRDIRDIGQINGIREIYKETLGYVTTSKLSLFKRMKQAHSSILKAQKMKKLYLLEAIICILHQILTIMMSSVVTLC